MEFGGKFEAVPSDLSTAKCRKQPNNKKQKNPEIPPPLHSRLVDFRVISKKKTKKTTCKSIVKSKSLQRSRMIVWFDRYDR